jgi:hypothetical protein
MLAPNGPWADAVTVNASARKELKIMALMIFMVSLADADREE